ncbi:winged helix-turn-helix domain-containing tetratricopeptide repeat protein [Palleronia abyssalis]|uniref:Transcriptional regulator HilA n=1 Tax=Palleronia abyssalis TaxID=1501240 RepID=A0A2R8C232_9RHOB|nr:winged helix-turn-helix domain-containing protein [Palleronia abyssalis]SPJ26477.1 Transcriptional regulator HilA [Palleronia abyssalis]
MRFLKRNVLKSSEIDLGAAVFDVETRRLHDHSGEEIALRFRSREVLAVLMRQQGHIVGRSTLAEAAWDVKTVSDDSIAQCIADIRRALSDKGRRIVETVPRQGYRLVLPSVRSPTHPRSGETGRAPIPSGPAPEPRAPVIEVLRFDDLGTTGMGPPGLRDVLGEAIVIELARYPEMTVLHRAADSGPSGGRRAVQAISRTGSDYLVAGALLSDGKLGRLSIRLISARDLSCIWVEEFDFDLGELLALSRGIGRQVASAVGVKLIEIAEARIDRGDLSARLIENAARSRMLRNPSAAAFGRNIREQDIALDRYPDSAWGHLGQALALRTGIDSGWLTRDVEAASARAEDHVARAHALAPDNYLVHFALGKTLADKGHTGAAILALERATTLNPSSTMVLVGQITPNLDIGNTARALELISLARRINPAGNKYLQYQIARAHWRMGSPDKALRSLMASPGQTDDMRKLHAVAALELGRGDMARAALGLFLNANPHWNFEVESMAQRAQATPSAVIERWLSRLSEAGMPH